MREARGVVRRIAGELPRGARVLDLGCGRGYVGAALEGECGCWTVGCDVAANNDVLARYCLVDGRRLPFRSAAFDAAVLAFVLHHARDPLSLLREGARVTRGRLLVLEDTPRTGPDRIWGAIHCRRFNRNHGLCWFGCVRPEREWKEIFGRVGLRIGRAERMRRLERFPPVARTLYVLERKG